MRLKIQQLDYEKRQLDLEQYKEKEKAEKVKKKLITVGRMLYFSPLVVFFAFITIVLVGTLFSGVFDKKDSYESTPPATETVYVEPFHFAICGEDVSTRDYTVCLEKWDYFTPHKHMTNDNAKYIKLHFKYTNTSEQKIYNNNKIHCYDRGREECDRYIYISDEDRAAEFSSQTVMPGKSHSGWLYFEVPQETEMLFITFGDSVEFSVNIAK